MLLKFETSGITPGTATAAFGYSALSSSDCWKDSCDGNMLLARMIHVHQSSMRRLCSLASNPSMNRSYFARYGSISTGQY
eukprot:scaffold4634_cov122-Cylindrotheca_fusiformis.AAC.9